jgi:hypothetical protein
MALSIIKPQFHLGLFNMLFDSHLYPDFSGRKFRWEGDNLSSDQHGPTIILE